MQIGMMATAYITLGCRILNALEYILLKIADHQRSLRHFKGAPHQAKMLPAQPAIQIRRA